MALYLGRWRLTDWNEVGAVSSNVQRILVHPDFRRTEGSFDADIAILIMPTSVQFNQYIRPICEWSADTDVNEINGTSGTVAGWGRDADNRITGVLRQIVLPIVDSLTCVRRSDLLNKAVSPRTFCAGTLNGDGPCQGDSGERIYYSDLVLPSIHQKPNKSMFQFYIFRRRPLYCASKPLGIERDRIFGCQRPDIWMQAQ